MLARFGVEQVLSKASIYLSYETVWEQSSLINGTTARKDSRLVSSPPPPPPDLGRRDWWFFFYPWDLRIEARREGIHKFRKHERGGGGSRWMASPRILNRPLLPFSPAPPNFAVILFRQTLSLLPSRSLAASPPLDTPPFDPSVIDRTRIRNTKRTSGKWNIERKRRTGINTKTGWRKLTHRQTNPALLNLASCN